MNIKRHIKSWNNAYLERIYSLLLVGKLVGIFFFAPQENPNAVCQIINIFVPVVAIIIFGKISYDGFMSLNEFHYLNMTSIMKGTHKLYHSGIVIYSLYAVCYHFTHRNKMRNMLCSIGKIPGPFRSTSMVNRRLLRFVILEIVLFAITYTLLLYSSLTMIYETYFAGICHALTSSFLFKQIFQDLCFKLEIIEQKFKEFIVASKMEIENNKDWDDIGKCIKIHISGCNIANECARLFEQPLLLATLAKLICIVTTTHYIIRTMITIITNPGEKYDFVLMSWSLSVPIVVLLSLSYSITSYTSIIEQAEKTATYIHDIWNNLASRNRIGNRAKHLQLIALQLYNSKLKFTACGFFPLDWTLLHRVIAAVTTYVVMLIQFEISSNTRAMLPQSNTTNVSSYGS